jgi:acyl-coenzyme A thioesterase PaaI-like protein
VGEVTIRSDGEDEPVAHVTSTYSIPPQDNEVANGNI